jgi:hypothetical protein
VRNGQARQSEPERIFSAPVSRAPRRRFSMNAIIYLVGLVVIVMFILSIVGLR